MSGNIYDAPITVAGSSATVPFCSVDGSGTKGQFHDGILGFGLPITGENDVSSKTGQTPLSQLGLSSFAVYFSGSSSGGNGAVTINGYDQSYVVSGASFTAVPYTPTANGQLRSFDFTAFSAGSQSGTPETQGAILDSGNPVSYCTLSILMLMARA